MRGMEQKAVDTVTTEPFFHIISDVARRADERTLTPNRGEAPVDLSDRQPFFPRPANDVAGIAEALSANCRSEMSGSGPSRSYSDRSSPPSWFKSNSSS